MYAEEGVARIRHGIDVTLQPPGGPVGIPIEALEGQHRVVLAHAEPPSDAIGIEAGGVDGVTDLNALVRRADPAGARLDDGRAESHLASALAHARGQRLDDRDRVSNRSGWRPQRALIRARQGLELAQACLIDHLQRYAVGLPPRIELVQLRHLLGRRADDDLAHLAHRHAALLAEGAQHLVAATGELGLERVGCVVEACVQHAGVATRGVLSEALLLVEHEHL